MTVRVANAPAVSGMTAELKTLRLPVLPRGRWSRTTPSPRWRSRLLSRPLQSAGFWVTRLARCMEFDRHPRPDAPVPTRCAVRATSRPSPCPCSWTFSPAMEPGGWSCFGSSFAAICTADKPVSTFCERTREFDTRIHAPEGSWKKEWKD